MPTTETTAVCVCNSNYTGFLCEASNPCTGQSNPCQNEAICNVINVFNQPPLFDCECQSGFSGKNCQINLNSQCTPNYCSNGGTCYLDTITLTTKCACLPLFTGKLKFSELKPIKTKRLRQEGAIRAKKVPYFVLFGSKIKNLITKQPQYKTSQGTFLSLVT